MELELRSMKANQLLEAIKAKYFVNCLLMIQFQLSPSSLYGPIIEAAIEQLAFNITIKDFM